MSTVKELSKVINGRSAAEFVESYSSDLSKVNTLFACKGTLWNWDMVNSSIRYGLKTKGVTEKSAQELYKAYSVQLTDQSDAMKWYVLYKLSLTRDTHKTVNGNELPAMFLGDAEAPAAADKAPDSDISIPENIQFLSKQNKTFAYDPFNYNGGTVEIMSIVALSEYHKNNVEDLYNDLCIQGDENRRWVDNEGNSLGKNLAELLTNVSLLKGQGRGLGIVWTQPHQHQKQRRSGRMGSAQFLPKSHRVRAAVCDKRSRQEHVSAHVRPRQSLEQ